MSEEETYPSAFVCPNCDKPFLKEVRELLDSQRVACPNCGSEITLDRRGPRPKDQKEE